MLKGGIEFKINISFHKKIFSTNQMPCLLSVSAILLKQQHKYGYKSQLFFHFFVFLTFVSMSF